MRPRSLPIGFVTLQLLLSTVQALTPWNVTASNFARAWWQSSIIIDNWMYIEGGEYYTTGPTGLSNTSYPPTLSIDLSTSWSASSLTINEIPKPADFSGRLSYRRPGLFWQKSSKTVAVYSGDDYSGKSTRASTPYTIWGLKLNSPVDGNGVWSPTTGTLGDVMWPHNPSSVDTPSGGFVTGGHTYKPGIALLNMTVIGESNTYTGIQNIGPFAPYGLRHGSALFVPSFGTGQGIIVYIGGSSFKENPTAKRTLVRRDGTMLLLSTITIYDIASKQWYTQTAGGDVPSPRLATCITGAQGANLSTYEIFLHGGAGSDYHSPTYSDSRKVYILTLPAFRWISTSELSPPRAGSTCQTMKNQMISYGGYNPILSGESQTADPWAQGVQVFDLTKLTWSGNFNANAPAYVQSDLVSNFYSINPLYTIWDNSSLAPLFTNADAVTSPVSPVDPAINPNQTSPEPPPPSKNSAGPIAGGVIGGAAFLAGIMVLAWFFVVRPRKNKRRAQNGYDQVPKPELHGVNKPSELDAERTHEMAADGGKLSIPNSTYQAEPVEMDANYTGTPTHH